MTKTEQARPWWRRIFRFNRMAFILNSIFFLLFLACYFSRYINPGSFWPAGILTLLFPFVYVINLLFFLYWGLQMNRKVILSFIALLIGINTALNYFQLNFSGGENKKGIKVMTYNVRVFDYYNWSGNKDGRNRIIELMRSEACDIYCMQEIYTDSKGAFLKEDSLKNAVNTPYAHIEITKALKQGDHMGFWGIGTFSKYPIINKGKVDFPRKGNNVCIFSDVVIDDDTVRIYNMHLQSIHMRKEDYKFLKDLSEDKETEEIEGSKKILRRLKVAFQRRGPQVDVIKTSIMNSPYPVIITGDFNDPPASYTYRMIAEGMKDAFREKGNGFGKTYNGIFPSFRIDYILHSEEISCDSFETLPEEFSDHNAVKANLVVN